MTDALTVFAEVDQATMMVTAVLLFAGIALALVAAELRDGYRRYRRHCRRKFG